MAIGLVGRKSGMTRVFTEDGVSVPVTVVEVSPNRVTQVKERDGDGYRAIQVTAGARKASRVSKSQGWSVCQGGRRGRHRPLGVPFEARPTRRLRLGLI